MALDHFIPQVHLKNFYAPCLDLRQMYAFRKQDGIVFKSNAKSVCRVEDGSTNQYLSNPRAIEDFLKTVEPEYNQALSDIRNRTINLRTVYVISGFISYVVSCSPAAMRISTGPIESIVESFARDLDAGGELGTLPKELNVSSFTELLNKKDVKISVDEKYPQAIGIKNILKRVQVFGNFRWEVLINKDDTRPFFTSDYPIALEETYNSVNKVIPLAPDVALRVIPDMSYKVAEGDFEFENFTCCYKRPSPEKIAYYNKLIVQSSESLVFSSHNANWVKRFIQKMLITE